MIHTGRGRGTDREHCHAMHNLANLPGLLVIEADADTLERQGHSKLGDELEQLARGEQGQSLRFLRLRLRTEKDVRRAQAFAPLLRYPAIVLIAHGGPQGICVARDLAMTWHDVADSLAPLKPRALFAIACYGGSSGPTSALFDRIPTLQAVVGSPAPITIAQARLPMIEALTWAQNVEMPKDLSTLFLGLNAIGTNGVVFRRNRADFEVASPSDLLLADLFGAIVSAALSDDDDGELHRRRVRRLRRSRRLSPLRPKA